MPVQILLQLEPYGQTDMMVIEAVNLKTVIKQDKIKLEEPRTGTKDRIVTIMYGNYIIDLIENAWQQQLQEDEFDVDSIQLVWWQYQNNKIKTLKNIKQRKEGEIWQNR